MPMPMVMGPRGVRGAWGGWGQPCLSLVKTSSLLVDPSRLTKRYSHRAASSMCTHLKSQKVGKVAGVVGTSLERDVMIAPRSTIRASQDAFHFLLEAVGVAIALVLHTHTMRNRCQGCVCRCAFSLSSKHECRPDPRRRMASSRRRRCPSVCIGYGSACRP